MHNYGLNMQGIVLVERVEQKYEWTPDDIGRIILDYETGLFWLGAKTDTIGDNGWISVGVYDRSVKYHMIDWDDTLVGAEQKVSSLNIPCLYGDTTSVVQTAINSVLDEITALSKGEILQASAIRSYHLDVEGTYRVDARTIPIENLDGYFPESIDTIEKALNHIVKFRSGDILLDVDSSFGQQTGITAQTVEQALIGLEDYLGTIAANEVSATYPLGAEPSTVQFVLDALYQLLQNINFKDLIGTPTGYGTAGQFLVTDGVDSLCFEDLIANNIKCQYPLTIETNVQAAIWDIQEDIEELQSQISSQAILDAEQVTYEGNDDFNDVDSALDWLLSNVYTAENMPVASEVQSLGIGDATNVQDALIYLNSQFNDILSQWPCTVNADHISYYSVAGHTNVKAALDYLFSLLV